MSNAVFWGLTNKDIGNVLWNGVAVYAVAYTGRAVGIIVTFATKKILGPGADPKKPDFRNHILSVAIGAITGTIASASLAHRIPFIALTGQTVLKALVIGLGTSAVAQLAAYCVGILRPAPILGVLPLSGMLGYFRPWILYVPALCGSFDGSSNSTEYCNKPSEFIFGIDAAVLTRRLNFLGGHYV